MANDAEHTGLLQHYLNLAEPYLRSYGYLAVFVGVLIESFGIPAPGETLVIASGMLASQGRMSVLVLPLAWAAAVIGDNIGYAIGHFGGRRLVVRYGPRIGVQPMHIERVEHFFRRFGGGIVALARFFDVLRQLNGVVAGLSGMRWWAFLVWNALGAAAWIGVWGVGAYFLGDHLALVLRLFHRWQPYVIGVGVVAVAGLLGYLFWRHRPRSSRG